VRAWRDAEDGLQYARERGEAEAWYLRLTIELDMNDDRDKLPPVDEGYRIKLLARM
jgi:hypothetical protein